MGVGAASLLHVAVPPPATSPRRVSIPVLVRDGKPCHAVPHQQPTLQQTVPCSSADYYSVNSAARYGEVSSAAFGVTSYDMPSVGAAVACYPSYDGSAGPSGSATAAAAAFHQTSSMDGMITNLSGTPGSTMLPTAAAIMNSLNCAVTGAITRDPTAADCYGQCRW